MNDLLQLLSLNNLYRHFLPGALLTFYMKFRFIDVFFGWFPAYIGQLREWNPIYKWFVFVLLCFSIGAILNLLYRSILLPRWRVLQNKRRSIPTFEIYLKLMNELEMPINPRFTHKNLLHSQLCLESFLENDKPWREGNASKNSLTHFLYLVVTIFFSIVFIEIIIRVLSLINVSSTAKIVELPLGVLLILPIMAFTLLIIGGKNDQIQDIFEGQYLSSKRYEYKKHLNKIYPCLDMFTLLQLKKKTNVS